MPKEAVFTIKLEADLRDAFMTEAAATHRPASQIVREFMREFVQRQREAREHEAREHEEWFRASVQEALDDPRPGIRHETVIDEIRAIIDRIAAEKARR